MTGTSPESEDGREQEGAAVFAVMERTAAATIALGGLLHGMGMGITLAAGTSMPWWYWAVFMIALSGYETSAALILLGKRAGLVFAAAGPVVGGTLIAAGFVFPGSGLLCLIPGTYASEITVPGFWTLVLEPVAVVCSLLVLGYGPGKGRK